MLKFKEIHDSLITFCLGTSSVAISSELAKKPANIISATFGKTEWSSMSLRTFATRQEATRHYLTLPLPQSNSPPWRDLSVCRRYMVYMDENGDPEGNYTLIAVDNQAPKGYGLYTTARFIGKENGTNLPVSLYNARARTRVLPQQFHSCLCPC